MNPPSVEDSLAEPTRPRIGTQIAKNLHLVIPGAVLVVISVALMLQAQQEQAVIPPDAGKPTENDIKRTAQVTYVPSEQALADEIALQKRLAESLKPPPVQATDLPPIPEGPVAVETPEDQNEKLRREQIRSSPIIAITGNPGSRGISPRGPGEVPTREDQRNATAPGSGAPLAPGRNEASERRSSMIKVGSPQGASAGWEQPYQGNANEVWLQQQQARGGQVETIGLIQPTIGPVIHQGAVIPAVLITEINSDLPGQISALVTMDVYDSVKGRSLLIPKGSKLVGQYNSTVSIGQERVMAAFQRLIMPNGASINLAGMPGGDKMGSAGMPGDVNNHFWKMFSSSFLIAGISWVFDKNSPNTVVVNGDSKESASSMAGEILQDISQTILERNRVIPPTITVSKGEKINILVNKDLALPAYMGR